MRISDWSSDVCSSDLPTAASSADLRDRKHSFNISLLRPDAKVSRDSIEVRWRAATSPADRPLYSGTPALLSPSTKTSQWANLARCRRTKPSLSAGVLRLRTAANGTEERRVGKEGVSASRSRCWPFHLTTNHIRI